MKLARVDVNSLIADLLDAFPRQPIKRATRDIYVRELEDLPPEALAGAVRDLIRESEFFPTIRAIRAATAERLLRLPTTEEALAQVEARMRWGRAHEEGEAAPEVDEAVTAALTMVGGYASFRQSAKPDIIRAQFVKEYSRQRDKKVRAIQVDGGRALPAA